MFMKIVYIWAAVSTTIVGVALTQVNWVMNKNFFDMLWDWFEVVF